MRFNFLSFLIAALIVLPTTLYIYKFGFGLWEHHKDWANMGSFFGGVFGPILASISLFFLGYQYHLQTKDKQISIFEEDIMAFLPKLSNLLSDTTFKGNMATHLTEYKRLVESGNKAEAIKYMQSYIGDNIRSHTLWVQIDESMRHLKDRSEFRHRRMRAYILSECEIQDIVLLDQVRLSSTPKSSKENCLFLES